MTLAIDLSPEMAWAVGIFEGEGSIVVDNRPHRNSAVLTIQMTDMDIIERFQGIVNKGKITGPYKVKNYQSTWKWGCYRAEDVRHLLTLWLPYLGNRRKSKALEAIDRVTNIRTRCRRGHLWNDENTYLAPKTGARGCRSCISMRARNYRKGVR